MSKRLALVGLCKGGTIAHLNCIDFMPGDHPQNQGDSISADGIMYCMGCGLQFPPEVCDSFEEMEDGKETDDKPHASGGYDPPVWQYDGLEWRMS